MHAISSYRGNRSTHKHTYTETHPHTGPITIHRAAKLSAQWNKETGVIAYLILSVVTQCRYN